jgi:hypothetical protein
LPVQVIIPSIIRPDFFTHHPPQSIHGDGLFLHEAPALI